MLVRSLVAVVLLSSLMAVPAGAGPLEDGITAYQRGDYATALRVLRPLAARGDAYAQFFFGSMYSSGEGVPKDDREAARWLSMAAEQA
ncbi:MAG: sel1 repeat family protein [Rhodospirillales bacterium]|nr:sel1 repeat family protein [Rhodospirillales bacterium]